MCTKVPDGGTVELPACFRKKCAQTCKSKVVLLAFQDSKKIHALEVLGRDDIYFSM